LERTRRFEGTYLLYLQGRRENHARRKIEAGSKLNELREENPDLKMEAICSSETSGSLLTTQSYDQKT
jgi:hypothetical protein